MMIKQFGKYFPKPIGWLECNIRTAPGEIEASRQGLTWCGSWVNEATAHPDDITMDEEAMLELWTKSKGPVMELDDEDSDVNEVAREERHWRAQQPTPVELNEEDRRNVQDRRVWINRRRSVRRNFETMKMNKARVHEENVEQRRRFEDAVRPELDKYDEVRKQLDFEAVLHNVSCYEGCGYSGSCLNSVKAGWVKRSFFEGMRPWQVKWIKFVEFMLCINCFKALAFEIAEDCPDVFGVELVSALGMPEQQAWTFIRELATVFRGPAKLQVNVPCFIEPVTWAKLKESYGLSSRSECETVSQGPRGYDRSPEMRDLQPDEARRAELSVLDFEVYQARIEAKSKLWDKLELRNAALLGNVPLTPEMDDFVVDEDISPEHLVHLKTQEMTFDRKIRRVLYNNSDTEEKAMMKAWLGSKAPAF